MPPSQNNNEISLIEKWQRENRDRQAQIDQILAPIQDQILSAKKALVEAEKRYDDSPKSPSLLKALEQAQAAYDVLHEPVQELMDRITENELAINQMTTQMTSDRKARFNRETPVNKDRETSSSRQGILGLLDAVMNQLFETAFKYYLLKAQGKPVDETKLGKEMKRSLEWMAPGDKWEYEIGFNFLELCAFLGFNPHAIRSAIARMGKMSAAELDLAYRRYEKAGIQTAQSVNIEETSQKELV